MSAYSLLMSKNNMKTKLFDNKNIAFIYFVYFFINVKTKNEL